MIVGSLGVLLGHCSSAQSQPGQLSAGEKLMDVIHAAILWNCLVVDDSLPLGHAEASRRDGSTKAECPHLAGAFSIINDQGAVVHQSVYRRNDHVAGTDGA